MIPLQKKSYIFILQDTCPVPMAQPNMPWDHSSAGYFEIFGLGKSHNLYDKPMKSFFKLFNVNYIKSLIPIYLCPIRCTI